MEYCNGGCLSDYLKKQKLSKFEMLRYIRSIAAAVSHLHDFGLYHGNIKTRNIVLHRNDSNELRVKLGDLGWSNIERFKYEIKKGTVENFELWSPEILDRKERDKSVFIFCLIKILLV